MRKYGIPAVIFLAALVVSLHYAYSTQYWTVYDGARDYDIFNYYREHSLWHPMSGALGLQNTAVFSTYIPAVIQEVTHLPSLDLFRTWVAVAVAVVPVMVYFVSLRLLSRYYAIFAALFVMGWVSFYQGGSYARSNFAMIIYGGIVLCLLSRWKYRYLVAGGLAALSSKISTP